MSCIKIVAPVLAALCLLTPAQAVTSSSAYQGNAAHDGRLIMSGGFVPPLHQAWARDMGGYVGYPIVAGGLAFVLVTNREDDGTNLYALDLQTGKTVWRKPLGGVWYWSSVAYDNGRLFLLNANGLVQAVEADRKGKIAWAHIVGLPTFSEIDAADGHVYVSQNLFVYSLDGKDGHVEWSKQVNGSMSSPGVGDGGVYFGYPCQYYKFDQATGQQLWNSHLAGGCHGGGDANPVYYDHKVLVRDWATGNWVLNSSSGHRTSKDSFPSKETFAVWPQSSGHTSLMVVDKQSTQAPLLRSIDLDSGKTNWNFHGEGNDWITAPPLVLGDMVAVGSAFGKVYLLDAATGDRLWSADAGAPILDDGTVGGGGSGNGRPRLSFGAGEDVLLVPASTLLVAYKP